MLVSITKSVLFHSHLWTFPYLSLFILIIFVVISRWWGWQCNKQRGIPFVYQPETRRPIQFYIHFKPSKSFKAMDLVEIKATDKRPYRCYIRGSVLQSEGANVHTIGFKDGLAVVQVITPPAPSDMKVRDNAFDNKPLDLSKLKKIIVKVDPQTGKKYILKDGKKIEIVPQLQNSSILNIKTLSTPESKPLIIKRKLDALPVQKLNQNATVKVLDNMKFHVLSLNVKRPEASKGTMTDYDLSVTVDKELQTDSLDRRDSFTQTESSGRDSPFLDLLCDFILNDGEYSDREMEQRRIIDPSKLKTKEEINKFNFFNDMRKALNFDRSGNLPIHESVMQNSVKNVQKNCIVLRAVRENVNIFNQQGYSPLHLAIIHDVCGEIVKILLAHGADLRVADPEGNTAIHLAIENKRSAILKALVHYASETNFNFDVFNYEGFTPLILAVMNGSYNDAKLLLQHKADPNVKDMKSGRTALFHAAECFDANLVELLMEYKADTKIRNFFGTSPHDAMFEVEDMPLKIKFCILGRDHQRLHNKKKAEGRGDQPIKKAKLETTPVLKKVSCSDLMFKPRKK